MAYAVHFRFDWKTDNDNVYRIDILQDGYSGSIVKRPLGGAPQLRRNKSGNICGTSLEFLAQALVDGEFSVLYTPSATAYRVNLYQNSTLIWQGYVTPELYSEPYIAPPYNVRVTATDNLGELKLSDYTAQGRVTIASLLSYFLGKTGLSLPVHWLSALHPSSATNISAANMPSSTQVNLDHMEGKTCYDVLSALLDTFHAIIVQHSGQWLIVRETDLESLRSGATITAPDGATFAIGDFGSMTSEIWWPAGFLSQTVKPAKKEKVITALNNWIENLLPDTATSATHATKVTPANGDSPYYDINGLASLASVDIWSSFDQFVPTRDLQLSLVYEVTGTNAQYASRGKCAYVYVKIVGSDGSSYVNAWVDADGNLTGAMTQAAIIERSSYGVPTELNISLPVFSQMQAMSLTKIYQIQLTFATTDVDNVWPHIKLYQWHCNINEQNRGYQVTCVLNNGARGSDGNVELPVADNTEKALESVFITNGLKYTVAQGGASILEWASDNIPSLPLLEFLARDYCLSIATPRLLMEGKLNVPYGLTPPLLFRGGGLIYWPDTWDWDLYADRLDISMLSLPAASVQVTSVTRQAQGSDGMIISGGGGAPSGGDTPSPGGGSVTSVGIAMPTGFTVSGSPITTAGVFSIAFAEGYSLPQTADVTKGVTAYGWGDHRQAGYLTGITSQMVVNALGFTPTANTGTVTSIKVTTPTGLRVSNGTSQTITGSGTFAITLQSGYAIPTTESVNKGVAAYNTVEENKAFWTAGTNAANAAFAAAVTNRVDNASDITDNNYNLVTANAIFDKFNGSSAFMPVVTRTSNYNKIADNATGDTYLATAGAIAKYVQAAKPTALNDLTTDVSIAGPSNGDFFCYSSSLSKWTNVTASNLLQTIMGSTPIGGQQNGSGMYRPIYWGGSSFIPIPAGSVASGNNYPVSGNEVYTHFLNTAASMSVDTTSVTSSQSKVPTSYAVLQYVGKITDASTSTWQNNTGCLTGAAMYGFLQESALMPVSKYADTTALPTAAANDGYFNIPSSTGTGNPGDNHLATCSLIYKYIYKHWWGVKDFTPGAAASKGFTTSVTSGSADLVTSGAVYTAIRNYYTNTISYDKSSIEQGTTELVTGSAVLDYVQTHLNPH